MLNRLAPLGKLPRDTRDTLFLLAVIGWVALMQVPHIPWWCSALTAAVLVWRATLTLRGKPLVERTPASAVKTSTEPST